VQPFFILASIKISPRGYLHLTGPLAPFHRSIIQIKGCSQTQPITDLPGNQRRQSHHFNFAFPIITVTASQWLKIFAFPVSSNLDRSIKTDPDNNSFRDWLIVSHKKTKIVRKSGFGLKRCIRAHSHFVTIGRHNVSGCGSK